MKRVEALDFDVLACGHGPVGTRADATAQRVYVEVLMSEVTKELATGKSIDEVVRAVSMDQYKDWDQYDAWIEMNVRGMAKWVEDHPR